MALSALKTLVPLMGLGFLALLSPAAAQCQTVTTAPNFNLTSYISAPWYVQQQAVNRYLPDDRFFCVRADYTQLNRRSLPWGYTVGVENTARDAVDGTEYGGDLCAYEEDGPAKLAVAPCFLPKIFAGPYWIIAYNEDEGYALVSGGQPTVETENGLCRTGTGINDSGLWVFTRQQTRNETLVEEVRSIATSQGFDVSVLKNVVQDGCIYECQTVTTAPNFNLISYISAPWYVQQQAVNRYLPEDRFFCVRASYRQFNRDSFPWGYSVAVDNTARDAVDGTEYGGNLCAYEEDGPTKLAVAPCFLPKFFAGPYWIIAYNEDEGYALVSGGQPTVETDNGLCRTGTGINDSGLWVFTRQQTRNETLVEEVRSLATSQGFDTSVLVDVVQEGCIYDDGRRSLRGDIAT